MKMQSNTLLKLFNATLMIMFSSQTDRALISIQETIRKPWRMLKHALSILFCYFRLNPTWARGYQRKGTALFYLNRI